MKTRMFLALIILMGISTANAINLQKFHFSNSPVFATLEDGLLDDGFITTNYKYILVGSYNYVKSPFIQIDGSNREKSIIDWTHTFNLGGAYRLNKNFQIGLSTFFAYQDAQGAGDNDYDKKFVLGDTTVDFKYKFYEKNKLAIAFTPRLYLPTGNEDFFTSNKDVGFYLGFAFDKAFRYFQLAVNLGHKQNNGAEYLTVDHVSQLHFSVGGLFPLIGALDLTAEFYRDTPYDQDNEQIPSEINVGLRYNESSESAYFAGVGTGSLFDESNSIDLRLYAGYKYFPGKDVKSQKIQDEEKRFGRIYKVYSIYFDTGSSTVGVNELPKLEEMIKNFKNDPYISRIVIEGYTSKVGSIELNKKLSRQRAKAVTSYVVDKGIDASVIEKVSYGNSKADSDNRNKDKDRKVMFRVYRKR